MRLAIHASVAGAFLLLFVGCGDGAGALHPVKGTVTYQDGTPVADCTIALKSTGGVGIGASGEVKNGAFTIMTGDKEGAPAGKYKVSFGASSFAAMDPTKVDPLNPPSTLAGGSRKRVVAAKYEDPEKSGLEIEVPSGGKIDIVLKVDKPTAEEEIFTPPTVGGPGAPGIPGPGAPGAPGTPPR